jgi:hypothetical protein
VYGTVQLATQDFCDAPGYTIATCL